MKKINTHTIAGTAILAALTIILQIIGNYIHIGPVSINLSLLPISIGAILYGPFSAMFLGFVNGILVLLAPSTISIFIPMSVIGTILTCIVKGGVSGLISSLVFKAFKNKNEVIGSIVSSLIVPVTNTFIFICFAFIFYRDFLYANLNNFPNIFAVLIFGIAGWNFLFEFLTNGLLTPVIIKVCHIHKSKIKH